ncbi:hypothetical protein [Pseudomonas graminis]
MDNIQASTDLNFDALLASLLVNKKSLACEGADISALSTESIDSFGSWYEAD